MRPLLADGTQPGTAPVEKPCCKRLGNGMWCVALDGHEGSHIGIPRPTPKPASELFGPAHIAEANARRSKR